MAYRLLGNAHEDVLTAFEATLKAIYLHKVAIRPAGSPDVKTVGNGFRILAAGNDASPSSISIPMPCSHRPRLRF
ncbi:hypothetical protein ABH994_005606 [Bradyrhizobium yuanmingense]|uniref:hypothetical protein n=1 Tax=Bradyrhizobium yuanmingense TaxID=108015 RepID=UPI003511568E